jgi:methionine sulfoxide reductase heme-binding subunit
MQLPFRLKPVHITILKVLIHFWALAELVFKVVLATQDQLGADPVKAIIHFTGISAFNLLLLSLLVSPLAKLLKQGLLVRVRRLLGLYAFFYALLHFSSYLLFELQLEWGTLLTEIAKRPYMTVGFSALLILAALAATSTQKIQRKMGSSWQKLHNWIYLAGLLVALHFIWSVKSDLIEPLIYWIMLLFLLYFRKDKLSRKYNNWLKNRKKTKKLLA